MKIFVAGGTGAIGRPLIAKSLATGHALVALTLSPEKAQALVKQGIEPAIADVFDADAVKTVVSHAQPEVVIEQLTDLPRTYTPESMDAAAPFNTRIRLEGGGNVLAAATCVCSLAEGSAAAQGDGGADAVYYGTKMRGVSNAETRTESSAATVGVG